MDSKRFPRGAFDVYDLVGAPVETTSHGRGIVRKVLREYSKPGAIAPSTSPSEGHQTAYLLVEIDEEGQRSGFDDRANSKSALQGSSPTPVQRRTVHLTGADLACYPVCSPGTPILTTIGAGVLVSFRTRDSIHVVRLWRPRGAGSALAYLSRAALIRPLQAAVGTRVETPRGHGVVVRFSDGAGDKPDMFDVKLAGGQIITVSGNELSNPVAKVMPLIERVADRSKSLVSAQTKNKLGSGARDLLAAIEGRGQSHDPKGAVNPATGASDAAFPENRNGGNPGGGDAAEEAGANVGTGSAEGESEQSDEWMMKLVERSRDEENKKIESLLETGRQRLEELIASARRDTEGSLVSSDGDGDGDRKRSERDVNLVRLWEEAKDQLKSLADEGSQALELDRHLSGLRTLARDSPELKKIVGDLEAARTKAVELQAQLEGTKSVEVLMKGRSRLEAGLGEVVKTYRDDGTVKAVRERGENFLKVLTKEDSPAVVKGMELLRGAQERAMAHGDGWTSRVIAGMQSVGLEGGRDGLSDALQALANSRGYTGSGVQEVIGLLRGDSASRVTDDALRLLENLALAFIATAPPPDRSRVYIDVSEMESGDAGGVSREGEGERHLEGAQQQAVGAGGADSDWEAVSKEEIGDQVEVSSSGDRLDEDAEIGKEGIGVGQGRTGEADVTHDAEGGGEHSAVGNGRKGDDGVGDGVGQAEPKEEEEEEPQGWCAQDLVDCFESGQLAEEVLRGVAKQATLPGKLSQELLDSLFKFPVLDYFFLAQRVWSDHTRARRVPLLRVEPAYPPLLATSASSHALTLLERFSTLKFAEGSEGMRSLQKLLERYKRGEAGLDEAMACATDYLNSEEGQSLAGVLVSRGEWGLESLKSMPRDGAVGRVLEHLADPALEARIMRGIENLDTGRLLDTAERAMTDAEARTRLLDGIKDSTVDFLLEYLPHIEVPSISGTSTTVAYAITNLDMSGFRLKKEDVEVELVDPSSPRLGANPELEDPSSPYIPPQVEVEVEVEQSGANGEAVGAKLHGHDGEQRHHHDGIASSGKTTNEDVTSVGTGNTTASSQRGSTESLPMQLPAERPGSSSSAGSRGIGSLGGIAGDASRPGGSPSENGSGIGQFSGEIGPMGDGTGHEGGPVSIAETAVLERRRVPRYPVQKRKPAEVLRVIAKGVRAEFKSLQWACRQETFPYTRGTGTADAVVVDGYVQLGFALKRGVVDEETGDEVPLLVLSTSMVSLNRLDLTVANCRMAWLINLLTRLFSGTIRTYVCRALQAELDGHASDLLRGVNDFEHGPLLGYMDADVGTALDWVDSLECAYAMHAKRTYWTNRGLYNCLMRSHQTARMRIHDVDHPCVIETQGMRFAKGSLSFLLSLTSLKLEDLPVATAKELEMARGEGRLQGGGIMAGIKGMAGGVHAGKGDSGEDGGSRQHRPVDEVFVKEGSGGLLRIKGFVQEDFGVVFDEEGPLGMQVDVEKGRSGQVLVSAIHAGGQAERLFTAGAGAQAFSLVGAELLSVGGVGVQDLDGRQMLGLLRSSSRPVQIVFRCWVPDVAEAAAAAAVGDEYEEKPPVDLVNVSFTQKSLGVKFRPSSTLGSRVAIVGGFSSNPDGSMKAAEASGLMIPGQILYSVNGKRVLGREFPSVVRALQRVGRPVRFGLLPGVDMRVRVGGPPLELELRRLCGRVTVAGFCEVPTALEASGAIRLGDEILAVNGLPLPGLTSYRRDEALLKAPGMFPMRLRMHRSRPGVAGTSDEEGKSKDLLEITALEGSLSRLKQYQGGSSSSPTEVVVQTPDELSLTVVEGGNGRPVVRSMPYVKGRLERDGIIQPGMVIVEVGSVPIPGGHFGSVAECRRYLDRVTYPITLTFRDMPVYLWLARVLAAVVTPADGEDVNLTLK